MKKILLALAIIAICIISPASATIVDDIYSMIFGGELNPQVSEWNNESYECGSATFTIDLDGMCTINYVSTNIPRRGGIVVELGTFDSAGYLVPIWGGDVISTEGQYKVNLVSELQRTDISSSNYYVRVVDTSERSM